MKKMLTLTLAVFMILTLAACGEEDTRNSLEKVQDEGVLVMGLDATFAPMGFTDDNDEIVGYDVDLAREVADRMGVELELQPIDWNSKVLELDTFKIDMVWNGFTITPDRAEKVLFSEPYMNNRQVVMTLDDSIQTLEDLEGRNVGVQMQSSGQTALESSSVYEDLGEMTKFDTYDLALEDLKSERIDAVVIDEIMGRYVNSQQDDIFSVPEFSLGDEEYGIGFRSEDEALKEEIESVLRDMAEDGTGASISEEWFSEDLFLIE
ncbi:MAG: transporter substrate-binding domain-containing protein [Bacillota bacterium]